MSEITSTRLQIQAAAQTILSRYDQHMSGSNPPDADGEFFTIVSAIAFAGEARAQSPDKYTGEAAAFRALMLALIDIKHPDLDYLRADPSAGVAARAEGGGA
ncbi:hypothetical protein [Pseudogemmobacter sonorensis]|uniref:hypothetical protein n=1 Tax=Pseudogemmobacter sonorensis TaxID=2989681 RepID=UPI00368488C9